MVAETAPAPRTASVVNLGCKVSFADAEAAARDLAARGLRLVAGGARADLVVINTCTVTAEADRKSRQAVRRARRHSPDADIVVTGCSAHVAPEAFAALDAALHVVDGRAAGALGTELALLLEPGLDRPLPTLSGVDAAVLPTVDGWQATPAPATGHRLDDDVVGLVGLVDGITDHRAREERTRAFVKVQDGCSFHCTYCVIPRARGAERSVPPDAVIADVRRALAAGQREIVLTGINIGTYDGGASERGPRGSHRWEALSLAGLIRRILDETPVERLRLSSIEPQHVSDDLLRTWTDAPERCLPHFHLPLQSGDDGVLRRMGRRYDTGFYAGLVGRIRSAIPGVAVHADVIVGFSGEDEAAWARSSSFIQGLELAGLHVFRYSERAGTAAVRMAGRVPEPVRRARAADLLAHASDRRASFAAAQAGRRAMVLFEQQLADGRWIGHAENHVVVAAAPPAGHPASLENVLARVDIAGVDERADRCWGRIVSVVGGSGLAR